MSAVHGLHLESGPRMKTTMVHVLDLLGCVANGPTTEAALEVAPAEIRTYLRFLQDHGEAVDPEEPFTTPIAEHVMEGPWLGYGNPASGFGPDFQPLTREELALHLRHLAWLGEELTAIARELPPDQLASAPATGRPIGEILRHAGATEAEYLRVAGLGKSDEMKELVREIDQSPEGLADNIARLWQIVGRRFESATDEELSQEVQRGQSRYTARRGLRRALEHPWEHLREIQRRLTETAV